MCQICPHLGLGFAVSRSQLPFEIMISLTNFKGVLSQSKYAEGIKSSLSAMQVSGITIV